MEPAGWRRAVVGWGSPRAHAAWALAAVGLVAVLCVRAAFHGMFSGFRDYDDEGYLLLSLRHYSQGGRLYDQLYTQYGPAYFQLVAGVLGLIGPGVTHTAGRVVVLVLWLLIPAACAVAVHRLTGNLAVTLGTQLLVFQTLLPLRNEPPHPGGPLSLLVAALVVAGCGLAGRGRAAAAALIGGCLAAATLMKINIGLLAAVSTGFVVLAARRPGPVWWVGRAAGLAAFLLAPIVLMASMLEDDFVRAYLGVVLCAALAAGLVLLARPAPPLAGRELLALVAGVALTTAGSLGWELARGTSGAGLLHGILLGPLGQPALIALPLPVDAPAVVAALAALGTCVLVLFARRGGRTSAAAARLHGPALLLAGGFVWLVADERLPVGPLASLPLLWLALTTTAASPGGEQGRRLLVAVAVLQALHAFPVAGSQVAWATFLFIPVGALLIADGWAMTVAGLKPALDPVGLRRRVAGVLLGSALVALVAGSVAETAGRLRAVYEAGVPLGLPGAEAIRVAPRQAALYQQLATTLASRCATFMTMPGLNSLYLFSQVEAPTMRNTTLWSALLPADAQAEIAARLAGLPGTACVVRRPDAGFDRYETVLTRYIRDEFVTVFTVGPYDFMVQRRGA